jgi:hypothetical protein
MHAMLFMTRRTVPTRRRSLLLAGGVAFVSAGLLGGMLGGCTTRNVVLTNTGTQPVTLSSTGTSDGWDYERQIQPGESFELKVGANQPISLPGLTVQVR